MEGMRAARLRSLTALLLLASCLSPGAADTGGCECALTVEAVGDTITSESMWRKKLQQLLPDITMVSRWQLTASSRAASALSSSFFLLLLLLSRTNAMRPPAASRLSCASDAWPGADGAGGSQLLQGHGARGLQLVHDGGAHVRLPGRVLLPLSAE
eukprot:scaffold1422_cov297-Prasinococcus_capsulatus_cf.AAC.6